jgi:hypothetical protein
MRVLTTVYRFALATALLTAPLVSLSQTASLSLKHGIYVRRQEPCKDTPNAAMMGWDGVGFFGAHSSKCTSRVSHRDGSRFQLMTSCSALGDGSQDPSGTDHVDTFLLTRLSNQSFEIIKDNQPAMAYRWCSAK